MDLVPFEFGMFLGGGQANAATIGINTLGNFKALGKRVAEQLPHHQDNVFIGVIVVIPQNHVVARLLLSFFISLMFRCFLDDWLSDQC